MITVNAIGDTCPIPVVKTKKAIEALTQPDTVETLVDNEVAVENLKKMAAQKGYSCDSSKLDDGNICSKLHASDSALHISSVSTSVSLDVCA